MTDKKSKKVYLIDPGFNRYGRREDFDDYLYFGGADTLSFLEQKSPDAFFQTEEGTPIVIRNDTLLTFSVEPVEGFFDKDNFMLALSINRRYKFSGRFIFAVRKFQGKVQNFENKWYLDQMLGPAEFAILQHQIMNWFDSI